MEVGRKEEGGGVKNFSAPNSYFRDRRVDIEKEDFAH